MMNWWSRVGLLEFFFILLVLVGLGILVFLVIWAVVRSSGKTSARGGDHALEILRERYACGEITREEYEVMMRHLAPPPQGG